MRKIYAFLIIALLVSPGMSFGQISKTAQPRKVSLSKEINAANIVSSPKSLAPGCDTLLWFPAVVDSFGAVSYTLGTGSGYLAGTNKYNDRQKGNIYNIAGLANQNYVTGIRFAMSKVSSPDLTKTVKFRIYDLDTNTYTLNNTGNSADITLSALQTVVGGFADYFFPTAIPIGTSHVILATLDVSNLSWTAADSVSLYSTNLSKTNVPDIAIEQWSDSSWNFMSDVYQTNGLFVYIFPYVSDNSTCALPVTMANLNAAQIGSSNQLKWTTKTEISNKGFEIQRSTDGNVFTKIDFVESKALYGNSNQPIEYEYTDMAPGSGANYYRIKQIDINGKLAFSNIALLNRSLDKLKGIITYYPNPVKSALNLQLASTEAGNSVITVINMSGMVVLQQSLHTTGSLQNVSLNVANLPKGTYIVRLNGEDKSAKFVKE